ncbi:MAG: hypothetical protein AAB818_02140 [Patescibacteria group bacterium]
MEKIEWLAGAFFTKLLNEISDDLEKGGFAYFLKEKAKEMTATNPKIIYSGFLFNTLFSIEYAVVVAMDTQLIIKIKEIIKKLQAKKSEADKMLAELIRAGLCFSIEQKGIAEVFSMETFSSFVFLLGKELGVKMENVVHDMYMNMQSFILEKEFALLLKKVLPDPSLN